MQETNSSTAYKQKRWQCWHKQLRKKLEQRFILVIKKETRTKIYSSKSWHESCQTQYF